MKLKNLFKIIIVGIIFTGCAQKEIVIKKQFIYTKCPTFDNNMTVPATVPFTLMGENGKILISKKDFKNIIDNYIIMKNEINATNQKIKEYNENIKRINNETSN